MEGNFQNSKYTVFPRIVSAETILFLIWSQYISAETIQGRKLFKGGNHSREETIRGNTVIGRVV